MQDETKGPRGWKEDLGWTLFALGTVGLILAIGLTLAENISLRTLPVLLIPAGLLIWSGWKLVH